MTAQSNLKGGLATITAANVHRYPLERVVFPTGSAPKLLRLYVNCRPGRISATELPALVMKTPTALMIYVNVVNSTMVLVQLFVHVAAQVVQQRDSTYRGRPVVAV